MTARRIRGADVDTLDAGALAAEYTTPGETVVFVIVADVRGDDHTVQMGYHGPTELRFSILRKIVADLAAAERRGMS